MRLLIISDIHANPFALKAIEKQETWDEIYCCGDLVDYGPFPMQVIDWCREREVKCVLGNHDAYVLSLTEEDCVMAKNTKRWKWAHDNYQQLTDDAKKYLCSLPLSLSFQADGIDYQMQHQYDQAYGTIESLEQFQTFWMDKTDCSRERRLLFGHSHRRCVHMLDDHLLWLNPGSVSYRRPDDHDKRAHYMLIDDTHICFKSVSYDRSPLLAKAQEYLDSDAMLETDLQDAFFFFGDAPTTRSPLSMWKKQV